MSLAGMVGQFRVNSKPRSGSLRFRSFLVPIWHPVWQSNQPAHPSTCTGSRGVSNVLHFPLGWLPMTIDFKESKFLVYSMDGYYELVRVDQ